MLALRRMNRDIDVRHVLPAIRVPTLIAHGTDDEVIPVEGARYMAQQIAGARLVELPGAGHLMMGDVADALVGEVGSFLAEARKEGAWNETEPDRMLATVLFTDIVESSQRMVELGDRAWRELLERHHSLVRRQLARFRGVEIDTAGDGFFGSFDGPAGSRVPDRQGSRRRLGHRVRGRGERALKGVPGTWQLYAVSGSSVRSS
jgi:TAP-like protein